MAGLTGTDAATADSCCSPERQADCCEPSAKADCCGHEEDCGCDAGSPDIRETVRAEADAPAQSGADREFSLWMLTRAGGDPGTSGSGER
jgi:hypothetical protein